MVFSMLEPQEPKELSLQRACALREVLRQLGCTNKMAAEGKFEPSGEGCEVKVCEEDEYNASEEATEAILKEIEVIFAKRPLGLDILHKFPLEVVKVQEGSAAAQLGIKTGWHVQQIGDQSADEFGTWKEAMDALTTLVKGLPAPPE